MYDTKYIKTKIKVYNNKINTIFYGNKIPEDSKYCNCLSATLLDSVVKIDNDYYSQIFLEECKYVVKKKKLMNTINEQLDLMNMMMIISVMDLVKKIIKIKTVF